MVDVEGLIEANSRGFAPGNGDGVGRSPVGGLGGSGGSHGGLGGLGSHASYSRGAYGNALAPSDYGSGGALMEEGQTDGTGGGAINIFADEITVDGKNCFH